MRTSLGTEGKLAGCAGKGNDSKDFVLGVCVGGIIVTLVTTLAGIALLALEHRLFPGY